MACPGPGGQQESSSGRYLRGSPVPPVYSVETRICPAKDGIAVSLCLVDSSFQSGMEPEGPGMPVGWVSPNTWDSRSKSWYQGQCLDHVDISKETDVIACSRTRGQPRTPVLKQHGVTASAGSGSAHGEQRSCGRTVRFAEQPCTPCLRRKHGQGTQECRYQEFYTKTQKIPVTVEKSSQKSGTVRTNSKTLHRPALECSGQSPEQLSNCSEDDRNVPGSFPNISKDLINIPEDSITCLMPNVVGTSKKCQVVVQGQTSEGNRGSSLEMLPRLHVVPGKKTTTFGLVSPKLNRRRTNPKHGCLSEDNLQESNTLPPLDNGSWRGEPKSTKTRPAHLDVHPGPAPAASKQDTYLMHLGVACLTGGRDRSGRPIVEVNGDHTHWGSPVVSLELSALLIYFNAITRKVRDDGLTIVYDARNSPPHPKFTEAVQMVQEQDPQAIQSVILLQNKEKGYSHEKDTGHMDIVTSLKVLHKCLPCSQLTPVLAGSFIYNHRDWLHLHRELQPFVLDLKEATNLLLEAMRKLEGVHKIDTVQDVEQCISEQRALMKDVLEDSCLVALQREAATMLARLRWECGSRATHCEQMCEVMDNVEALYNQVEEQIHVLARRCNVSLQHLDLLLQLREMESRFTQIKEWFEMEGDRQLLEAESVEVSSGRIQDILQSFSSFLSEANEQKLKAMMLLTEVEHIQGPNYPETEIFHTMVSAFKSSVSAFLSKAEQCCDELLGMVNLCHFCERSTEVAEVCSRLLEQDHLQCMAQEAKWTTLKQCHQKLSEFSPERFQDAKALAASLQSPRGMQVWNMAWLRCQDVSRQLEESLQDLERVQRRSLPSAYERHGDDVNAGSEGALPQSDSQRNPPEQREVQHGRDRESVYGSVTCFNFRQSRKGLKGTRTVDASDQGLAEQGKNMGKKMPQDCKQKAFEGSGTAGCQWFPWKNTSSRHRGENSGSCKSKPSIHTAPNSATPFCSDIQEAVCSGKLTTVPTCSETMTTVPTHSGTLTTVPTCSGTLTPVPICSGTLTTVPMCSGTLTIVPTCSETLTTALPCSKTQTTVATYSEDSLSVPPNYQIQPHERPRQAAHHCQHHQSGRFNSEHPSCKVELMGSMSKETDSRGSEGGKAFNVPGTVTNTMKLWCILEELLVTELEYVRSMGYVLTHYLPLLARPDVPSDLRGQRGRIFGNLEKLHDFHCHCFLHELEACRAEPLRVGHCFLRHKESFGLYALYSKNKPQSDALIQHHKYFKRKQLELGDSMDLSSYLLKPVQRISKYSLLLQEMLEECRPDCGPEHREIQAAAEVVRFQLRHGNDLLTMDAIQDCDVNLKEQGQLIRQDEFYVTFRRKRALRRVFLFQELILFTKTKKTLRGDDVYVYKQSFKTCDIGLTRSCGESGLCFEIWFRRRREQDTFILQAGRQDVKQAWTTDLEHILWKQALKNRELWKQERVFMGVDGKSFMDVHPNEAAIHENRISCLLPGRESEGLLKTANFVVSSFQSDMPLPRPASNGSGSCVSTSGSRSSSSSGRGSLSPRGLHGNQTHCNSHGMFLPLSGDDYQNQCHKTAPTEDCTGSLAESSCVCGGCDSYSTPGGCPAELVPRYMTLDPATSTQPTLACTARHRPPVPARNKLTWGCDLQSMAHSSQKDREQGYSQLNGSIM